MRYPLVIGNWKLNGSKTIVKELIINVRNNLNGIIGCNVAIAPPVIYLDLAHHYLYGSKIDLGAQNVDTHLIGAYTGEISANMLKDIGAKYIIIGHSERRIYHQEKDEYIAKKFAILKETGLIPVLCIGENKIENNTGQTKSVCIRQIDAVLNYLGADAFNHAIIAYEPIWAIGTGQSAIPEQVQNIHKFIRDYIAQHDNVIAQQVIILYGGSVNTINADQLFSQPDIDGSIVGGAALTADSFTAIIQAACQAKNI